MGFRQVFIQPTTNAEFATQIENTFAFLGYSIKSQGVSGANYEVILSRTKAMEGNRFDMRFTINSEFRRIEFKYIASENNNYTSLSSSYNAFTFNILDNNKDDYMFSIYYGTEFNLYNSGGILTTTNVFDKSKRKVALIQFKASDGIIQIGDNGTSQRHPTSAHQNTPYMIVEKRYLSVGSSATSGPGGSSSQSTPLPETFDNYYNVFKYSPQRGEVINFEGKNLMMLGGQLAFCFD